MLFEHTDYKVFIRGQIAANRQIRGYQTLLAKGAGCQRTYLSQVLSSKVHLTPDHAANLANFWKLDSEENEYFLELVNLARAGTPALKNILLARLEKIRERKKDLSARFKAVEMDAKVSPYYSSWIWSALHILLSVPKYKTLEFLAQRLQIPESVVLTHLLALKKMELVEQKDGCWIICKTDVHLPKNSPWVVSHHNNWRSRAVLNSQASDENSLHYTSVVSMSYEDFGRVRELFVDVIERKRKIVKKSSEEDVFCAVVDLFRI